MLRALKVSLAFEAHERMRGLVLRAESFDEVGVERVPIREHLTGGAQLRAKDAIGIDRRAAAFEVGQDPVDLGLLVGEVGRAEGEVKEARSEEGPTERAVSIKAGRDAGFYARRRRCDYGDRRGSGSVGMGVRNRCATDFEVVEFCEDSREGVGGCSTRFGLFEHLLLEIFEPRGFVHLRIGVLERFRRGRGFSADCAKFFRAESHTEGPVLSFGECSAVRAALEAEG